MRSSSGSAHVRNRSTCRQSSDDALHQEQLTAGALRDMSNNPELSDSCFGFIHTMRGTIVYWQRTKLDLLSTFRTLGPPTFFITLTTDDVNWPNLLYVLYNIYSKSMAASAICKKLKLETCCRHANKA